MYWSYPILPYGIFTCTFFPTTSLEIAVYSKSLSSAKVHWGTSHWISAAQSECRRENRKDSSGLPPPTKTNFCAHTIVVNEGKLPCPETWQVVGFFLCLVPFRSRPCSSTHQHVLVAGRHWTSAKLPSLLHLGTNFILSQRLFFISSRLCSHFVRAEIRVKIEVSFWSFNVKEEVAREYFKDFVYTELTLWRAHEV